MPLWNYLSLSGLSSFIIIHHYLSSYVIIYHRLSSLMLMYHLLSLVIIIYDHLWSVISMYHPCIIDDHLCVFYSVKMCSSRDQHLRSYLGSTARCCVHIFQRGLVRVAAQVQTSASESNRLRFRETPFVSSSPKKDAQECFQDGSSKN